MNTVALQAGGSRSRYGALEPVAYAMVAFTIAVVRIRWRLLR
jgi:hypothetical protein